MRFCTNNFVTPLSCWNYRNSFCHKNKFYFQPNEVKPNMIIALMKRDRSEFPRLSLFFMSLSIKIKSFIIMLTTFVFRFHWYCLMYNLLCEPQKLFCAINHPHSCRLNSTYHILSWVIKITLCSERIVTWTQRCTGLRLYIVYSISTHSSVPASFRFIHHRTDYCVQYKSRQVNFHTNNNLVQYCPSWS